MPLLDSENLFIDTSIFVKENFLDGRRINSILDLSKQGYFKLLFSPIIINEIKIRYRKFVRVAYTLHNELVNDKKGDLKVLRNHSLGKQILARFPSEKDICKEFNDKFDQALVDCNAVILDYPTLSIEAVFSDYFSGKSPFDKADKKHEFPDAFAIAHMEQWCQQKKEKAIVFTNDKGFAGKKVPSVRVILNYEDYVEELLKKIDPKRIGILNDLLESNKKKIEKDVIDSVKEDLYRDDTYDDLTNWAEVHNIDIKYLKPTMWQHQIVTLNIDSIEVEYTIDFDYKVVIETDDDETGIYDSEDHRWLFREIKKMTVKEASQYTLLLRFAIVNEEEFDDEYEILRYNNGMPFDIPKKEW